MSTTMEQHSCDSHTPVLDANSTSSGAGASAGASAGGVESTIELETLQQALVEKQNQLLLLETACLRETERQLELEDSVIAWQDKYDRLYESHKRVQKVNQSLEDKMLKLVDRNTSERAQLTSDVATLSVRLAQANFNIAKLQREIERYKNDISLAIQLLQCKPESFVPQKVSSLPIEIQSKVSAYMRLETNSHSDSECSNSGVGVATTASYKVLPASDSPPPAPCPFPPTAMVYSMRGLDAKGNQTTATNTTNSNQNNTINNVNNNTNGKDTTPLNHNHRSHSNSNNNINNNSNNNNNSSSNSNKFNSNTSLNSNCTNSGVGHIPNASPSTISVNDPDMISPIVMAKFLEDELKASEIKHCDTCQCTKQDLTVLADVSRSYTVATQTPFQLTAAAGNNLNEPLTQLCLRCNSNLNSPSRTNSPYLLKLVKSSDSVISETKSSVSDLNDMDKLFTPAKKDDLMVNPILGHHRLCERTLLTGGVGSAGGIGTNGIVGSGSYAADKYLLETANHSQLRNGYQRRFLDGGGTALELLGKYDSNQSKQQEYSGSGGILEELDDEVIKPLLSGISQSNLLAPEQPKLDVLEITSELISLETPQLKSPPTAPNLMKSTTSGSVNSLWSKTSSNCDGAKMFENFNRNLIKTIKAENPRHRGPRLCAMRIQQNGQSNILLDNIESIETFTPIIYKRRERLLDEELDDTKDIITSGDTNGNVEGAAKAACTENEAWRAQICALEVNAETPEQATSGGELNLAAEKSLVEQKTVNQTKEDGEDATVTGIDKTMEILGAVAMPTPATPGSKKSNNSKSCTQSSSISDAIDFQENVLLRRQQLSRVAEWVQNNTQQLDHTSNCDSATEQPSSYSTLDRMDSISIEKLSLDSGYKTTPQQPTNGYAEACKSTTEDSLSPKTGTSTPPEASGAGGGSGGAGTSKEQSCTTYYRRTTRSGLPVAYTTAVTSNAATVETTTPALSICGSATTPTFTCPKQPTCDILNYKYYPDTDKTRAIQAELHTTTQNVDIAQMEYNVKQFLLKQNEWSMRGNSGQSGGVVAPGRPIRQTKLFGPGMGERIRMAPGRAAATVSNNDATAGGGGSAGAVGSGVGGGGGGGSNNIGQLPYRTETNL